MKSEPLITAGVVVAIISAIIAALQAFDVPITDEQHEALKNLAIVLAPFVVALIGRMFVTPLSDPKIKTEDGHYVSLVRSDTGTKP